ncbi:hypothetical protein MMC18_002744 [Xylographa bjoerkii]|nr:hypothetical protein [Xylographa bjoerkii]
MYCGPVAEVVTLSYSNLVSTGSTAFPPTLSAILTVFPTSALESILSAQLDGSTSTTASSTSSNPTSSSISMTSSSITGVTGIVTVTTTSVLSPSSTRTLSSTMSSTISDPSRDSAQAPSPLSSGAIAGISIGSAVIGLLIMALISYFCVRPYLYRRAMLRNSRTPRGTLGGATLPGPQLPIETYESPRRYVNVPHEDGNDINSGHQRSQHDMSMVSYGGQRTPWNASSVGDGRGSGTSELHGETTAPLYNEEQAARRLLPEMNMLTGNHNSKSPVTSHALVAGRPMSGQRRRSNAAELAHTERSVSGSNSPNRSGPSSPHLSVPSPPSQVISRESSQRRSRLSATGGHGYVSPEQAMAEGLNSHGDDDDEDEQE